MKSHAMHGGDAMPALGLGTWKASEQEVERAVGTAIEAGYRHIDCAAIYGNEAGVGRAIRSAIDAGTVRREELWITSKLWNDAHQSDRVAPALERTLADLGLDALDLYLVHWPIVHRPGVVIPEGPEGFLDLEAVPLLETWRALEACVDAGRCRNIGVSNFSVRKLERILEGARIRPAVDQVEAHPYLAQSELLEFCQRQGIVLTAYSPLGSPDRPDMMKRADEPSLLGDPVVGAIAEAQGITPAQVILAWGVARGTAVIPKSVSPRRQRENLVAADIDLGAEAMARLDELDRHYRFVLGAFWPDRGAPFTVEELWDEAEAVAPRGG